MCLATLGCVGVVVVGGQRGEEGSAAPATRIDHVRTEAGPVVPAPPGVTAAAPATAPAPAGADEATPPVAKAPAPAAARPAAPVTPAAPLSQVSRTSALRPLPTGRGGTWAVVFGVDDYRGRGNLRAGVADANEITETLLDAKVPGENILLLRNSEVTPASILAAADWLVDRVGEDGLAVFAWAGHIRAVDADTEALATGDGSLVTDASLAARLQQLRARRSWFLIAGCYGGGFTELLGPGRLLTAASPADEQAYENTLLGHSYVVEYVVRRGLHRREGPRTITGSVGWAQAKLKRDHPGREPVSYVSGPVEPFVFGPNPTPTPAEAAAAA